jgi:2,4-dienoyl-CoA reductase-like NADH-dependent reductase (Old Yellow Enzyme family)
MTLSAPFDLRPGVSFKNRIAKAAMTEGLAGADGVPNDDHVRLYRRWAEGDIGLSITGNVQIDRDHLERPGNVICHGAPAAAARAAWARWAAAATEHGTAAWVQISHAGRQTQVKVNKAPKAPSAVKLALPGGQFGVPVPLTESDISDLIARFAQVATVAAGGGWLADPRRRRRDARGDPSEAAAARRDLWHARLRARLRPFGGRPRRAQAYDA